MDLCEHLIGYCRRVGGLTHEEVKVQKDAFFDEMRAKEIQDHVNKQLKDGKIQKTVKDAQEIKDDFFNMVSNATAGGAKKGKKQRNRNKGQNEDVDTDEIQINIETISFFAHLQVKAPLKKQDCAGTVTELEKKLADYEERGNKELLELEDEDEDEKPHRNRREDD